MNRQLETASMPERFDHLLALLSSKAFLNREGLNNEVPFFICPYAATEAVEMASMQKNLVSQLTRKGLQPLHVDLYDLVVEILKREGDWDWLIENEATIGKDKLKEELQGVLDTEAVLVPEIAARMDNAAGFDVLILTGVGEVFPYIRSHNVLNNLQKVAEDQPTLMFFPGEYTQSLESGAELNLFGQLRDDKYYRAFNVFEREV